MALFKALYRCRKKSDIPIEQHESNFNDIVRRIEDGGITLCPEELAIAYLNSIPDYLIFDMPDDFQGSSFKIIKERVREHVHTKESPASESAPARSQTETMKNETWTIRCLTLDSGERYFGQVKGDEPHGWGESSRSSDGSEYNGTWKYGKKHGFGVFKDGEGKYEGTWDCGVKKGFGEFTRNDDSVRYRGEWTANEKNGVGQEDGVESDGWIGRYKDGKRHGWGLKINSGSPSKYDKGKQISRTY